MKRKIKTAVVACLISTFLAGSNSMAASYTFSFMTSGSTSGGSGTKSSSEVIGVIARTGNLSTSRYINVWGAPSIIGASSTGNFYP